MRSTQIEEIVEIIRRAEVDAYERGKVDAKRELLAFLGQKDETIAATAKPQAYDSRTSTDHQQRPAGERQRAPKGLVPKFIRRVLSESSKPLTPQEILDHASDDYERMIKPASIRSALRVGRESSELNEENGCWFLVSSEAEGRSGQDDPSASESNNGGKSNAAALI